MPDVAFDSERHAQASHDVHDSGQELAASAMSANVLAMARCSGIGQRKMRLRTWERQSVHS